MGQLAVPDALRIKLDTGDLFPLKKALTNRDDEDFKKGEVWQAILNLGYAKWQAMPKGQDWSYGDMVQWIGLEYGSFAKVCILLGKYNQQVLCNGHMGYWDNGFAGGDSGSPEEGNPLHKEMLTLMKIIGIDQLELGKKVYDVAARFQIEVWESDCDCDGHGDEEIMKDPSVDDDYANVAQYDNSWEKEFNSIVKHLIEQA